MAKTACGLDYYHVRCFETIANLTQGDFLVRIIPATRNTMKSPETPCATDPGSKNCFPVDSGAERLIYAWKAQRAKHIAEPDKLTQAQEPMDQGRRDQSEEAEPAGYVARRPCGVGLEENAVMKDSLGPNESGQPGEEDDWNILQAYLNAEEGRESLDDRHRLSKVLGGWANDVVCCFTLNLGIRSAASIVSAHYDISIIVRWLSLLDLRIKAGRSPSRLGDFKRSGRLTAIAERYDSLAASAKRRGILLKYGGRSRLHSTNTLYQKSIAEVTKYLWCIAANAKLSRGPSVDPGRSIPTNAKRSGSLAFDSECCEVCPSAQDTQGARKRSSAFRVT